MLIHVPITHIPPVSVHYYGLNVDVGTYTLGGTQHTHISIQMYIRVMWYDIDTSFFTKAASLISPKMKYIKKKCIKMEEIKDTVLCINYPS